MKIISIILSLLFCTLTAKAQDDISDDTEYFAQTVNEAMQGDVVAQYFVGVMYYNGKGTTKNDAKAFEWYLKAARNGNSGGQTAVGSCYLTGTGTLVDKSKAFYWFLKAAQQGDMSGQDYVGWCYENGVGIPVNHGEAFKWYLKSAQQGWFEAQYHIGACYESGIGTPINESKAFEWYMKAARQSIDNQVQIKAQYAIGRCYENGIGTTVDKSQAFAWYVKAATQGDAEAQYSVGLCYDNGDGTTKDAENAFSWYMKSAFQGHANAEYALGLCYEWGAGTEKDERKAFEWFEKSAKQGVSDGQTALAHCYEEGIGTVKDENKAFQWYLKSANNGDEVGEAMVGRCFLEGIGTNKDYTKAIQWLNKSERKNCPSAYFLLARCYMYGEGVEKNHKTAWIYLNKTLAISPDVPAIIDQKGEFYSLEGNIEMAKKTWDELIKLDSSYNNKNTIFSEYIKGLNTKDDVDLNIPITSLQQTENVFVVIIANEKYTRVSQVPFAHNDGEIFAKYCELTLGIPNKNIKLTKDATLNDLKYNIKWLGDVMKAFNGNAKIIFYYAGHGIPDEKGRQAYLLPVDGYGSDVSTGYALNELYSDLGSLPAKSVMIFLDACFSGTQREGSMIVSSRGVAIKAKQGNPEGKLIVFSASQGDETAYPYNEKKHGMFTYFLLKKIQESKGNITLGELEEYINNQVKQTSIMKVGRLQSPQVIPSKSLINSWKDYKLN